MSAEKEWFDRASVIAALVDRAPNQTLGRTAIMKLTYFLQVLRGVPLGYNFQLYNYGPFDSDVLDDLGYAEALGAVKERSIAQSNGYRYEIRPGKRSSEIQGKCKEWLRQHGASIDWIMQEFGSFVAPDLELLATIVFVDRAKVREGMTLSLQELAKQVRGIKPKFTEGFVQNKCQAAYDKGLLQAIA